MKKKKIKDKEFYPPEPFKRASYVSGGCRCVGCVMGTGHVIGYVDLREHYDK